MADKLLLEEQETIILWNNATKIIEIDTCDKSLIRKLDKLAKTNTEIIVKRQDEYGKVYLAPKTIMSFRNPNVLSAEAKIKLSNQMKERHSKVE